MNYFDLSYLNSEHKYNNIYSTLIPLENPINLEDLPVNEVLERTLSSRKKVMRYDLSKQSPILSIIRNAMDELVDEEKLDDYEIGFRIKLGTLSYSAEGKEIKNVSLKGVCNNVKKNLWFTIVLCN